MPLEQNPQPSQGASADARPASTTGRRWGAPLAVLLVLAAGGGFAWWHAHAGAGQSTAAGGHGGWAKGKGGMADRPMPVQARTVKSGPLHIYIDGLGTVTAANTALVKTRVDGQLMSIRFREGQTVRAGDLLAEIDPRPYQVQLMQAEGQLAKDQAALNDARTLLSRYQTLLAQDSIARQQVDTQAATVHQEEGAIKADQAQVASAKLNLTYARVTAPIGGKLGLKQVDVGNVVHASDATGIVTITQVNPVYVVFTVPEARIGEVSRALGSGHPVPVDALDRDQKAPLASGRLLTADNQIDTATGTVKLKAEFDNAGGRLFPNQFVNVHMLTDTVADAVLAPTAAIQRGTQGAFVFVVNPNGTVSLRNVQTGASEGDCTAILTGLKPGEQVVVDGLDKLRDGAKVQVIDPAARAALLQGKGPGARHGQGQGGHRHRNGQ